jgi:thermitase
MGLLAGVSTPPISDWYRAQPALQLVRTAESHSYSTGRSVVVADINSRVDYSHPALVGHLTSGYDFVETKASGNVALNQSSAGFLDQSSAGFLDQSSAGFLDQNGVSILNQSSAGFLDGHGPAYSHGTLCAGLISVVAPDAMIMPLRAFDDDGSADMFTLARAIRYAAQNGAQVINMSFGTTGYSKAMKDSVDFAVYRGVVLVASAGNNNTAVAQYPAAYAGVAGAAATDLLDRKASFSNYGSFVYVAAPGVNVISAYPDNQYAIVSGTSFSAPIVAGEAALVRSLRATGVTSTVGTSSTNINSQNPGYAGQLGYGRVDALRATSQ